MHAWENDGKFDVKLLKWTRRGLYVSIARIKCSIIAPLLCVTSSVEVLRSELYGRLLEGYVTMFAIGRWTLRHIKSRANVFGYKKTQSLKTYRIKDILLLNPVSRRTFGYSSSYYTREQPYSGIHTWVYSSILYLQTTISIISISIDVHATTNIYVTDVLLPALVFITPAWMYQTNNILLSLFTYWLISYIVFEFDSYGSWMWVFMEFMKPVVVKMLSQLTA